MKMNTADILTSVSKKTRILVLLAIALVVAILSSIPDVQSGIRSWLYPKDRIILAKIIGFYGVQQSEFLILKIRDEFGLQIEVYEKPKDRNSQIFRQKFQLTQDTDAYITLDKNTTNLALSDLDKDGQLDILAPSVDRNGNLRLNSFRFNIELNSFEPLTEAK